MNIRKIISGLLFAFTVTLFGLSFSSYWDALLVGQKNSSDDRLLNRCGVHISYSALVLDAGKFFPVRS
jgi:hypothetical protein